MSKLPEHYFAYNDGTPGYEIEHDPVKEFKLMSDIIREDLKI